MTLRKTIVLSALFTVAVLGGCTSSHGEAGVFAINPLTGEIREFASEGEVPAGWATCDSAETCPSPVGCVDLTEDQCLARSDCSPLYVGIGAYPMECETTDPPPDFCDGTAYAGCVDAADDCAPDECGPGLGAPTYICPDGSPGGSTGRCLRNPDGTCGWEFRDCPDPCSATIPECDLLCPPGTHNPTDSCGRVRSCECVPDDCSGVPVCDRPTCPPGTHNPVDDRGCVHSCECIPDSSECTPEECGPVPYACPEILCDDGSIGGCTGRCYRLAGGGCGWEIRECPGPALQWYETCGDPVCGPGWRDVGLPRCTTETAGDPCSTEGASCDPMDSCNSHMVCARTDPRLAPGGCPISRREFKRDIRYVTPEDRSRLSHEILGVRLATYRYRAAPEREHLGFIIEDQEPSASIDSNRDMVDLYGYTSMAVAALQTQAEEIAALRRQLDELRADLGAGPELVCR